MTASRRYSPFPAPLGEIIPEIVRWIANELRRIADSMLSPDPLWEDVRVSLVTARPGATNPPGFEKFRDNGAGSTGVFHWHFDASSTEELFFDVQFPHAFKEKSGVIKPHLHWSVKDTNAGTVKWGLEYTWANFGGVFPQSTIIYATDDASGEAYEHDIAAFTDIDASAVAISSVMSCRLFRDAGSDTYASDAVALSFDFHVQLDERGSELEYQKRL